LDAKGRIFAIGRTPKNSGYSVRPLGVTGIPV
jgi:hypothetical protein